MAESSPQTRPPQRPQYHHFVPRFFLRNFAVFKNPGRIVPKTSKKAKHRAPKPQKLTILDLKSGTFEQGDVSDTFGIVDMYRDFEEAGPDQHKLEKELSVLESAAAEIIARVTKTYEAGKKEVQLIRKDKDILRRFLFIMMYRNSDFAKRFEKSRDEYDSDDRESMLAHMDEKGFQKPKDVWFANIRAFMEIELDEDWLSALAKLSERAYPMDAEWFFMHVQMFFIAFCTPRETSDEFLLTQNVYSIYEGPTRAGPWTDYHRFAPVSPKITIVLRSLILPCAGIEEDETRRMILLSNRLVHHTPKDSNNSWLEDLPVSRARNNYSKMVNGKTEPLPTRISRDKHVFYFPFYPLGHEHVQKINMICLENAFDTVAMVYKSPESLRTALEFYLTDKSPGFKVICPTRPKDLKYLQKVLDKDDLLAQVTRGDKLLAHLQLLHKFARQLGSTAKLEYTGLETLLTPTMSDENQKRYERLGGTSTSLLEDFDQAERISHLIIIVDSWIRRESSEISYLVRRNREDLIATFPPRRVWLSIKNLRGFEHDHTIAQRMSFDNNSQKEDLVVDASRVFEADSLTRMIYKVFFLDFFLAHQPDFGLVKAINLDNEGAKSLRQEMSAVFDTPGSIRDCGIAAVVEATEWLTAQPRPGREAFEGHFLHRVLSDKQILELELRIGVELGFEELVKDKLTDAEIRGLKDVFFGLLYPLSVGRRIRK